MSIKTRYNLQTMIPLYQRLFTIHRGMLYSSLISFSIKILTLRRYSTVVYPCGNTDCSTDCYTSLFLLILFVTILEKILYIWDSYIFKISIKYDYMCSTTICFAIFCSRNKPFVYYYLSFLKSQRFPKYFFFIFSVSFLQVNVLELVSVIWNIIILDRFILECFL